MMFKRTYLSVLAAMAAVGAGLFAAASAAEEVCIARVVLPKVVADKPESQTQHEPLAKPRVTLVSARSFVARLMRRERPALSPGWRMCPSV